MARALVFVLFLVLTGLFALLNWTAFNTPTTLSLGLTSVAAPIGLIMLGLLAVVCLAFTAWAITLQGHALMDARRLGRDLQAQRELADKAEASRFTELRAHLDATVAEIKRSIEQQGNSVAASLGELEDRLVQPAADNRSR
jgi:hypothetical protein